MTEELRLVVTISASPMDIYEAWLDSDKHSAMTGSEATVDARTNGKFSAWDGYIEGSTTELTPHHRIVQKWRTTEFPSDSPDSTIEITLKENNRGTEFTLVHTDIPVGQAENYQEGWEEFYFTPMKRYFEKKSD